jgi:AcrR family transcriptional regulator
VLQSELIGAVLGDDVEDYSGDPTTERILDAALAEFGSFGLRRATVEDITRRARVGRMTLHRRFPSKQALIAAVFLREIRRVLGEVDAVMVEHEPLVDKLVEGLAFGIRAVHEHPLFSRLLETDPEAMLPYLTLEAGPLMVAASGYIAQQLRAVPRSAPTPTDATARGEAMIRLSHSILLTPDGSFGLDDPDALRRFLRRPVAALIDD